MSPLELTQSESPSTHSESSESFELDLAVDLALSIIVCISFLNSFSPELAE